MHSKLPLALVLLVLAGCHSKPVRSTETHRRDLQAVAYEDFVAQRTQELQRMGGPFQDRATAESKAREEAAARYGDVPAEYQTTWTWGQDAGKAEAQKDLNEKLEKMDRDAKR
jgi:hypothetical protein